MYPLAMRADVHQVVEKQSVLRDVEHEDAIPVYADHRQMCKFEKDDDDTFQTVWKKIEQIRKQSRPTSSTKLSTLP
jgi:hypothetical protein